MIGRRDCAGGGAEAGTGTVLSGLSPTDLKMAPRWARALLCLALAVGLVAAPGCGRKDGAEEADDSEVEVILEYPGPPARPEPEEAAHADPKTPGAPETNPGIPAAPAEEAPTKPAQQQEQTEPQRTVPAAEPKPAAAPRPAEEPAALSVREPEPAPEHTQV